MKEFRSKVRCFKTYVDFAEDQINQAIDEIYEKYDEVEIEYVDITPISNDDIVLVVIQYLALDPCDKLISRDNLGENERS